jgi:surface antigen
MRAGGTGAAIFFLWAAVMAMPPSPAEAQSRQPAASAARAPAASAARPAARPATARPAASRAAGPTRVAKVSGTRARPAVARGPQRVVRGSNGQLRRVAARGRWGGLQCVPFARAESGIEIRGNAHTWWSQAAGEYLRGHRPEPGAVLHFPSNGRMRLGHVAVVTRITGPRTIEIDQANWPVGGVGRGAITRGVAVVDVSPLNDWTAVRVEMGRDSESYGAIYPASGFIYRRPDNGRLVAPVANPAPQLALAEPHRDLRPAWQRETADRYQEVAQSVRGPAPAVSFTVPANWPAGGVRY